MHGYLFIVAILAILVVGVYPYLHTKSQVADVGGSADSYCSNVETSCRDSLFNPNDVESYNICLAINGCSSHEQESCAPPLVCPAVDLNTNGNPSNITTGGSGNPGGVTTGNSGNPSDIKTGGSPGRSTVINLVNPLKSETVEDLIVSVVKTLLKLAVPVAILFIIWSGFLFVMAQGNPEKIKTAVKTFQWTVIGLAIILGSYVIATIIKTTIESLG